jgi:hypothetical protein
MVFSATAASSYRANGNINGHTALTVCAFCAPDQTYDGRTYANPDEMVKIAENLLAYQPTFARFRRFRGHDRASHRLGQRQFAVAASQGDRGVRLMYSDAQTRPICLPAGIALPCDVPVASGPARVIRMQAVPATGRSATECRRTSVEIPRPRPPGGSHSARG